MTIPFIDPRTGEVLRRADDALVAPDGRIVARIREGVPRFVAEADDYADNFGWQWNHWADTLSDARSGSSAKLDLLMERTRFDQYDLAGRSLLECGMGGGDDTEVLLSLPLGEVHAFDLSDAVDRANRYLHDARLVLSQASILDIPYADESFDVVFCHRVLQHTPDPVASLRAICRKVKPGGLLFAHAYKRSWRYRLNYKYRYRWLTTRMEQRTVFELIERWGPALHGIQQRASRRGRSVRALAEAVVPFERLDAYGETPGDDLLEVAKLVTFDALTPRYDRPMTAAELFGTIEAEGFRIEHRHDPKVSPLWCTAVKRRST
jgi:ubiquinone/menaquinone biosynthesis C-methylase UbiE